jgi:hypothetical protein
MYLLPTALTTETIRDPSNACQKLSTEKPPINEDANQNSRAFITNINRPRVSTVIGRVSINKIGLTNRFNKPKVTAAINAGYRPSICMPGTYEATTNNIKVVSNKRVNIFM